MMLEVAVAFLVILVVVLIVVRRERTEVMAKLLGIDLLNVTIEDIAEMIRRSCGGKAFVIFSKDHGGIKVNRSKAGREPGFLPGEMEFLGGSRPISHDEKAFMRQAGFAHLDNFRLKFGTTDYLIKVYHKMAFSFNRANRRLVHDALRVIQSGLQIRAQSKQRMKETQVINDLNLRIAALMDKERILTAMVNSSRELLATDKVILAVAEEGILKLSPIKEVAVRDLPLGLYNQLFLKRTSMAISDVEEFPEVKSILPNKDTKSVLFVPVMIRGETSGLFVMYDNVYHNFESEDITTLRFLANQASVALERIDSFESLNRALNENLALQDLARSLLTSMEFDYLINLIIKKAREILGFDRLVLSFLHAETECFDRVAAAGIPAEEFREFQKTHPPLAEIQVLMNERFKVSHSFYIRYRQRTAELDNYAIKYTYGEDYLTDVPEGVWHPNDILIVPIFAKEGKLKGMISVDRPLDRRVPTIRKIRLLEAFADFVGLAVENAEMFRRVENLASSLKVLYQSTAHIGTISASFDDLLKKIFATIRDQLNYANVAILLVDQKTEELYVRSYQGRFGVKPDAMRLKIGRDGICGLVAREGVPRLVLDTRQEPNYVGDKKDQRSEIAVPLSVKGRTVGVLNVEREGKNSLNDNDLILLSILGSHIAVALENNLLYEEVETLSVTDEMTGAFNYRYLITCLGAEIERSKRFRHAFSLMMLDIDDFKKYNDTHGHLYGDVVLRDFSRLIAGNVRTSDILTRYGGDEFVVVLPETDKVEAFRLASRLKMRLEAHQFSNGTQLTSSIGIATYPVDAQEAGGLIDRVDQALYRAKGKGDSAISD